jgi:NAD(P)-dependent dehydrogenase (short-subunit alcohol dehydrogenase family)
MLKTVLITGAGQGLGRAFAHRFAKDAWRVILVGRTLAKLQAVAHELRLENPSAPAPLISTADLSDPAQIQALAQAHESCDVLINCAGASLVKSVLDSSLDDWERIHTINLRAPFLLAQAFLPHLRRSPNASIINIGSMTAHAGYADVSVYTAAKTGLLGLTHALSAELRPHIRVSFLSPGPLDTPMRWQATPDFGRERVIAPEIIAESALWIANLPHGVSTGDVVIQSASL